MYEQSSGVLHIRGCQFKLKIMKRIESNSEKEGREWTNGYYQEDDGIKRKPYIGFWISCIGTLVIWSLIGYFIFKVL